MKPNVIHLSPPPLTPGGNADAVRADSPLTILAAALVILLLVVLVIIIGKRAER